MNCYPIFLIVGLILGGCTTAPECNCISSLVADRIEKEVSWDNESENRLVTEELLSRPLSIDSAVQIALLNNPEIQAALEDVGIAHADLVQAGLLRNPAIGGWVRFPEQSHAVINNEFSIAQNILDLMLIPLRKKIAEAEYEKAQLIAANRIVNIVFEVEETFYNLQAEQAKNQLLVPLVDVTNAAYDLAKAQLDAGNINDLEFQSYLSEHLEKKVELTRSQRSIVIFREKLNRLLGLSHFVTCWNLDKNLPTVPETEVALGCLEEVALAHRLDLAAASWEVERFARMFGTKDWWAYTDLNLGVSAERDSDGIKVIGPTYSLELPIFNYGQADRERLCALYRQADDRFRTMEIAILTEVRSLQEQLMINRTLTLTYENEILPLAQQNISLSHSYYNTMSMSVYKLLHAKKQELEIQMNYLQSLQDYWISKVNLARALGGNLVEGLSLGEESR